MGYLIPTQRVFLYDIQGGATILPAHPRLSGGEKPLIGGVTTLECESNRMFLIVDSSGKALRVQGKQKMYEACSPASAATKAFYAWWRTTNQGKLVGSSSSASDAFIETYEYVKNTSPEDADEYVRALQSVSPIQIEKKLLVRVASAGKRGSIRNYQVQYALNTRPNKMEIKKRIVVNAKATLLLPNDPRPLGIVDLEGQF